MEIQSSLLDVFMPEDLCARCAEEEAVAGISLLATPSPSSSFSTVKLSFCSLACRDSFVRGWSAAKGLAND